MNIIPFLIIAKSDVSLKSVVELVFLVKTLKEQQDLMILSGREVLNSHTQPLTVALLCPDSIKRQESEQEKNQESLPTLCHRLT